MKVTLYRGTLGHPIVFPESIIITPDNIDSIDFNKVIYCEHSPKGAMGNEGGILLYVLQNEDKLATYETNIDLDKQSYEAVVNKIDQNIHLFIGLYGGMGNYVYVNKDAPFEIDNKYNCLWYHSKNTKLRINCSVTGVFNSVIIEMSNKMTKESAGKSKK